MFTVFLSWHYWLRLFLAFSIPFFIFTALMQQTAQFIGNAVNNLDLQSTVAVVQADTVRTLDLILPQIEKDHKIISVADVTTAQKQLMDDSVDIVLIANNSYVIKAMYNSQESGLASEAILSIIKDFERDYMIAQIDSLGINRQQLEPFGLEEQDLANPMAMIGRITNGIKGNVANVLNIIFVLLVFWPIRIVLMVHQTKQTTKIFTIFLSTWLGALVLMGLAFVGVYMGINIEEKGLIKGIITNINSFMAWETISPLIWLWIPTLFFVTTLLGFFLNSTRIELRSYTRSFWVVMLLHIAAFLGTIPVTELSTVHCIIPIYNLFGIGQVALQGNLDNTCWWVALASNFSFGLLFLGLWYQTNKYPIAEN